MATITQTDLGTNYAKLTVSISKDEYLDKYEQNIREYNKTSETEGHRKGMVPLSLDRKVKGASLFEETVLQIAGNEVDKYVRDNKIALFARPLYVENKNTDIDVENPADYELDFELGLMPEFEITAIDGNTTLQNYKLSVTPEMVDQEVEQMQYRAGKMSEPLAITSQDDVIDIKLDQCTADGAIIEGGISKDNSIMVKYFTPEMQSQLMGKGNGHHLVFNLGKTFDEKIIPSLMQDLGMHPATTNPNDISFNMEIIKLQHVDKAALAPEMFNDIYKGQDIQTEEAFRAKLESEMNLHWSSQAKARLHNEIFETLVHGTKMDLPKQFLRNWIADNGEKAKSEADIDHEYGGVDHQVRWQLISDRLIKENKIEVTKTDMETAMKNQVLQYFAQMGMGEVDTDAEWIKPMIEKQMEDQNAVAETANKIASEKLFTMLESKFKIDEKALTVPEFVALPHSHHHH